MVISKKKSSSNEIKISIDPQDFGNGKDSREKSICMKYLIFMNYYGFLFVYARNNLKSSTVIVYDIHSFLSYLKLTCIRQRFNCLYRTIITLSIRWFTVNPHVNAM